ncbi:MAG TPA: ADP-forming succinate--CoA ligase subunit beta [Anaerolineaceae bacterium]|jgi:succinyl-CoA synthetase beta subunit|nr:ADP-forming succinate--CoA ligase subunit beta [Anaerolineaceae bacterium]
MRLHEYQAKQLFAKYGIPVPKGRIAGTSSEVRQVSEELGGSVVVKSQVLVGGRGKAGGIRLAKSSEEAEDLATQILGMEIKGIPVRRVLVEEAVSISQEIYLGITNDRVSQMPVLIASPEGGMNIEEIARRTPEKIARCQIDPLLGLKDYQLRDIALSIDLKRQHMKTFMEIARSLWKVYVDCDATLTEVNPMVITAEGRLYCLDAKIVLDDNALFRHPDLADLRDTDGEDFAEVTARKYGVTYIKMDGDIGCLVNGAGLAMATMDILKLQGGEAANFLDIGGGASAEKVSAATRLILSDPKVKAILVNVFGGITRCDEVARGVLEAISGKETTPPLVVRFLGTNEVQGYKILSGTQIRPARTLLEAAELAVSLAKGGVQ